MMNHRQYGGMFFLVTVLFYVVLIFSTDTSSFSFNHPHRRIITTYSKGTTTTSSTTTTTPKPRRRTLILQMAELDKGFNLLEIASKVVPQGRIVQTAKESWKFVWKRMMAELAPQDKTGSYQRPKYSFGGTIGSQQFPVEAGRYHLYLGNPCPWCHRVKLVIQVLGLETNGIIGVTTLVDDPIKASRGGWVFRNPTTDRMVKGVGSNEITDLRGLYEYLNPNFQGRCTAPLLVDLKQQVIVSNESSDMVRMIPRLLEAVAAAGGEVMSEEEEPQTKKTKKKYSSPLVLCPPESATIIDETNEWVYRLLNNGVYRCGFSTTQGAYDIASANVLEGLSKCETILSNSNYLCGDTFTESDILLLPTMLRFDGVYAPLFKAGGTHLRLAINYPSIASWLKRCWNEIPGVSTSIDIPDATGSYYKQLFPLNPGGIIPTMVTAKDLGLEDEEE